MFFNSFAQIEVEESLTITDHKGNEQGHLQVNKKFLSSLYELLKQGLFWRATLRYEI